MFVGIIGIALIVAAIYLFKNPISNKPPFVTKLIQTTLIMFGLFGLLSRSFIIVDSNEVGHLKRIYLAANLPTGQILAANGEKGPQAEILGPGFHFRFLVKILYQDEYFPVISIPEGQYGLLIAKDGSPLRERQFISDKWPEDKVTSMLDAIYFLTEGKGQKGPQLHVLGPGKYRLNHYLFDIKLGKALDVPTGHVAVIRSNVQTIENCPSIFLDEAATDAKIATPIVPVGCVGVWDEPYPPGRYYLNSKAYVTTIIQTRLQTWNYKGGYVKRQIDITVDDAGKIHQEVTSTKIPVPADAADQAIIVRVEGWTVPVDMRVIVQVHAKNAPIVVASVGDLDRVENNIITPAIRDILRTSHSGSTVDPG